MNRSTRCHLSQCQGHCSQLRLQTPRCGRAEGHTHCWCPRRGSGPLVSHTESPLPPTASQNVHVRELPDKSQTCECMTIRWNPSAKKPEGKPLSQTLPWLKAQSGRAAPVREIIAKVTQPWRASCDLWGFRRLQVWEMDPHVAWTALHLSWHTLPVGS